MDTPKTVLSTPLRDDNASTGLSAKEIAAQISSGCEFLGATIQFLPYSAVKKLARPCDIQNWITNTTTWPEKHREQGINAIFDSARRMFVTTIQAKKDCSDLLHHLIIEKKLSDNKLIDFYNDWTEEVDEKYRKDGTLDAFIEARPTTLVHPIFVDEYEFEDNDAVDPSSPPFTEVEEICGADVQARVGRVWKVEVHSEELGCPVPGEDETFTLKQYGDRASAENVKDGLSRFGFRCDNSFFVAFKDA